MRKFYFSIALSLFALHATQAFPQLPEYCLDNDTVNHYLTQVTYDPNDYSYSKILNYCDNPPYNYHGMRKDHPKPVGLKLAKALAEAGTLYVSEWTDYTNALTLSMAKGADSVAIYNLIPNRTYNWKIVGASGVLESGQFKTTGHVRMLKIDGIFNVRDMGGWEGLNGYPLRYGTIIRGSRLNVNNKSTLIITQDGINELRRVGVRAELDMRNSSNAANATTSFLGTDIPIYNVNNAYNSRIATFANAPQSIEGVRKLIEWLKAGKPVYLHCSVGADRTGTVAFLVGALCGMSEDALSKEFELTSFSADVITNERTGNSNEVLVRQRSYAGRLDDNDNPASYQFASMIDKVKAFPGETMQEKVYYHLSTGAKGPKDSDGYLSDKVPTADLDWLIDYMLNPIELNASGTVTMEKNQTKQVEVILSKGDPKAVTYSSSNPGVAEISSTGLVTAKRGGSTTIKAEYDGYSKSFTVSVTPQESILPDTIFTEGFHFFAKDKNLIKNGSFEYLNPFDNWKAANEGQMTEAAFAVRNYEGSDERYIESLGDGDSTSFRSLRTMWSIKKNRTYVFGYRVKNSTDITTQSNHNLATSLVNISSTAEGEADDFTWAAPMRVGGSDVVASQTFDFYPTYGSEWTDVQYVFTNTDNYKYLQVWFTHLSKDGNNTCFDNFYLFELGEPTVVIDVPAAPVRTRVNDNRIYNLAGQEVTNPGPGIYIMNGKKYIVK